MKIKLACGITKQLEKEFLVSNFDYFKDYFQSSISKNEDEANLGIAHGNLTFDWTKSGVLGPLSRPPCFERIKILFLIKHSMQFAI